MTDPTTNPITTKANVMCPARNIGDATPIGRWWRGGPTCGEAAVCSRSETPLLNLPAFRAKTYWTKGQLALGAESHENRGAIAIH
jgi:hypothetical protein